MNATWYHTRNRCFSDISEFRFCCGDAVIGSARAHIVPAHPLILECSGLSLRCRRDPDMTLIPGVSIPVTDAESGAEYARIFWDGRGRHRLHTPFGHFQAVYQTGGYTFSRDGSCIAACSPIEDDPEYRAAALKGGWGIYQTLMSTEPLPAELAVLMLCFPLLAIGP